MPSVFETHGCEIAVYEASSTPNCGRLLFATAILSDVQEIVGDNQWAVDEIDEAKELIISVIERLAGQQDRAECSSEG